MCGVVDWRENRREENGKKTAIGKKYIYTVDETMKRSACKEWSIENGNSKTLAESGEGFGRHDMRRER